MTQKRILVVEDEEDLAELFQIGLAGDGYAVDVTTSISQARTRLDGLRYDLVIVDIRLPDGNGLQIADQAADLGSKTCILSGHLFAMPAGAAEWHDLLMKPIRPKELLAAVQRAIGPATAG